MATCKSIIRTNTLSIDRINGQFDADFVRCPLCSNVLWKPVACETCENAFCLKCIRLWLNKNPNMCPFNCHFQERKPHAILVTILSNLNLKCRYKSNGCTLSIPYEGLEKHELQECVYRIIQCPRCSEEIFKKDLDTHEEETCPAKELTCLKCNTIYIRNQKHTEIECLEIQITLIKEKLNASNEKPKKVVDNYNFLVQRCERLKYNRDQIKKIQLYKDASIWSTSTPMYTSTSFRAVSQTRTSPTFPSITKESLRISGIDFTKIPAGTKTYGHIPNGYAGFNWENAYYIFEDYAKGVNHLKVFKNVFTESRTCVAYNRRGGAMIVFLADQSKTFGLHSFEAISIYDEVFQLSVNSYRSNILFDTKSVILTPAKPRVFEIDWENVDRIIFKPLSNIEEDKSKIFVLTCLNLLL